MNTNRSPRRTGESGTSTLELVALVPLLAALMLFVVFCGRVTVTRLNVQQAARDAARAASIAITRDDAAYALDQSLTENLGARARYCTHLPVDYTAIAADNGAPGDWDAGVIELRLTCVIPTDDLGLLGIAGTKTFTATAIEPVDTWRSRTVNS